jgi:arginase
MNKVFISKILYKISIMKHITFFQHGLGQKQVGIDETVESLYDYYYDKIPNKTIIKSTDIKNNLLTLYNLNYSLLENGFKNINIGGDHSMAIASISASLNLYGSRLKVLWFDAHADIHTRASSPSGNLHGMPLSFLTGLDTDHENFPYIKKLLLYKNLYYIGIRDCEDAEIRVIDYNLINVLSCNKLNNSNEKSITELLNWIGNSPVHLSFDVDSLDPIYMPCTGTAVANGLEFKQVLKTLQTLCQKCNIVNLDIAELNLSINENQIEKCFNNFNTLIDTIYSNI